MNDYKKYNDYELLYLYNIHSEEALDILLKKYSCLIEKKLYSFRIVKEKMEDYRQECMLALMNAIKTFDERFNKTFNKYAELVIERKIMKLLRDDSYYFKYFVLSENFENFSCRTDVEKTISYQQIISEILKTKFNNIKDEVLKEIYFEGMSVEEFSQKHGIPKKEIYNHIYWIRSKLKKEVL